MDLRNFHPNSQQYHPHGLSPSFLQFENMIGDGQLLHLLATRPESVLPPGKRITSIFSDASAIQGDSSKSVKSPVEERVSEIVHKAFWDEVRFQSDSSGPV